LKLLGIDTLPVTGVNINVFSRGIPSPSCEKVTEKLNKQIIKTNKDFFMLFIPPCKM